MQTIENEKSDLTNNKIFELLDARFSKKFILYKHLHNSYNDLINQVINFLKINDNIFEENRIGNLIYRYKFKFDNIFVRPPLNENGDSLMYPMDARDRNLTYSIKFLSKIAQIQEIYDLNTKEIISVKVIGNVLEKETIASIPCMVKSKYCSLEINHDYIKKDCAYDPGGYFIVNGSEKIVLSLERMAENRVLVFLKKDGVNNVYQAKVNSKSLNPNIMMQGIEVRLEKNYNIVVKVPILNEVSVFVLMRALGLETDREIVKYIVYNEDDIDMLNLLKISIDLSKKDGKKLILSKEDAYYSLTNKLRVVKKYTDKDRKLQYDEKKEHLESLLRNAFMPHITIEHNDDIFKAKAYYLGYMINKLLNCYLGRKPLDDRDSFINKRIDMPGDLIFELFKQHYKKMLNDCNKFFKKRSGSNHENPLNIINQIKPSTIEQGIKSAMMTGNWGKKKGVAQPHPRLTYLQSLSILRRVDYPSSDTSTSKLTGIRSYHPSQTGMLCLTGDTEILMGDGSIKLIKDVKNGDSVVSVDSDTMEEITTPIKNWFKQDCDKLLKITTISGRVIKSTPDHKFLTNVGDKYEMVEIGKLKIGDNLIIRHSHKYIPLDKETVVIIKESDVSKQYRLKLLELGYLDKPISQKKLEILARLIGLNITDGHIGIRPNGKYYDCSFCVGEEKDTFDLVDDIMKLGFGTPSISRSTTKHINSKNGRETIYNTWAVSKNGAFAYLLNYLGAFDGKKTEKSRKVPDWIMNSNKRIQREFISGFVAGDGCRLSMNLNQKKYKISCGDICQVSSKEFVTDTLKYLEQISSLFKLFNIENKTHKYDDYEIEGKVKCVISIGSSYENLNNYADIINFRYCNEKRRKSALTIEYIKHKNHYADIKDSMYNDIIKLYDQGIKCSEICKTRNYAENIVKRIIANHRKGHLPKGRQLGNDLCLSYEDFIKDTKIDGEKYLMKIKSIEEIAPEPVYDFETVYHTHSFIANSFALSNCCVESPEHSNIGLVKHLSLVGSITIGSQDQAILIYKMLKDNNKFIHMNNHSSNLISEYIKIFLNGEWIGFTEKAYELYKELRILKQNGIILRTNGIIYDIPNGEIKIYTESGRLYRPILNVKDNKILLTDKMIIDILNDNKVNGLNKWEHLMTKYPEAIDMIDMEEQYFALIAEYKDKVIEMKERELQVIPDDNNPIINRYDDSMILRYTHCEIHPTVILGIIANNIPFANHNQGPRNIFQYAQGRQAMGLYASNYRDRLDISYILYHTQKPLVNTRISKYIHTDILPCGENAIVMIGCYSGHNQDDSIVFNQTSIDRGLFKSTSLKKWSSKIEKNQSTSQDDIFMKPDITKLTGTKNAVYDKLSDKGFVPEETTVVNGDVIIGKVTPIQPAPGSNKCFKDSSEIYKSQEPAIIDKVFNGIYDSEGYEMIKIRTRSERIPKIGDKFCCFSPEHDILTINGWKKVGEITVKDKVASLINGNTLEYVNPLEIMDYDYDGKMYSIETDFVDLFVTPNHRMYISKRDSNKYEIDLAENIMNKPRRYKKNVENYKVNNKHSMLSYVDSVTNKEVSYPTGFILKDELNKDDINILDINAFISFFGMWMAEGFASKTPRLLQVSFAAHKQRIKDELTRVCEILNFEITKKKDDQNKDELNIWSVSDKKLRRYMEKLSVGATNKYLPDWVWNLNKEQSNILIDSMILGDGHYMKDTTTRRYDTSSIQLANDFQKLCLHAGISASLKLKYKSGHKTIIKCEGREGETITSTSDAYRLTLITKKNNPLVNKNVNQDKYIDYKGKVYCCRVPGDGVIYVRRNGIPVWCGQSRHGQKGTIGLTLNQADMPFTKEGISPDVIINPNAIPSRMTVAQLIECLIGKVAAVNGTEADGTSFTMVDVEKIKDDLEKLGYERNGLEYLYNGITGQRMKAQIFIGPTFYQRLKHLVSDKLHSRSRGIVTMLTRQPPEGRSKDGGLRCGEMERDAIISHGMSKFLKERFLDVSDSYSCYVCDICGLFAQRVIKKENKSQPSNSDIYQCTSCKNKTKISKIIIPYAFKLLIQELMSMNIAPRIRTVQYEV
jgi:DNA-directed RNA polymerase beta subunit/intein/homing endonuclease